MVVRTVGAISRSKSRSVSQSSQDSRKRDDSCSSSFERYDGLSKTNIYICPIPTTFSKRDLENVFKKFGKIVNSTILTRLNRRSANRVDGFPAFVDFEKHSAAKKAVDEYNGLKLKDVFGNRKGIEGDWDSRLLVRFADAKNNRASPRRRRDFSDRRFNNRGTARRRANWDRPGRFPRRRVGRRRSRSRSRIRRGRRSRESSSRDRGRGRRSTSRSPRSRRRRSNSSRSRGRSKDRASSRTHRARYTSADSGEGSRSKSISRSRHSSEGSQSYKRRRLNPKIEPTSTDNLAPNKPPNIKSTPKLDVSPKIEDKSGSSTSAPSTSNAGPPKTSFPTRPPPKNIMDNLEAQFAPTTSKLSLPPPSTQIWNVKKGGTTDNTKKPEIKLPEAMNILKVESQPIEKKPLNDSCTIGVTSQFKYIASGDLSEKKTVTVKKQASPKITVLSKHQPDPRLITQQATISKTSAPVKRVEKPKHEENIPITAQTLSLKEINEQIHARVNLKPVRRVIPKKNTPVSTPKPKPQQKVIPPMQKIGTVYTLPPIMPVPKNSNPVSTNTAPTKTVREKIYPIAFKNKKQTKKKTAAAIISKPPVFSLTRQQNPYKWPNISKPEGSVHNINIVKSTNRTVQFGPDSKKVKVVTTKVGLSKPPATTSRLMPQPLAKPKPVKKTQLKPSTPVVPATKKSFQSQTATKIPILNSVSKVQTRPTPVLKRVQQNPKISATVLKRVQQNPKKPATVLKRVQQNTQTPATVLKRVQLNPQTPATVLKRVQQNPQTPAPVLKRVQQNPWKPTSVLKKVQRDPDMSSTLTLEKKVAWGNVVSTQDKRALNSISHAKCAISKEPVRKSQEKVKSSLNMNRPAKQVGSFQVKKVAVKIQPISEVNTGKMKRISSTSVPVSSSNTPSKVVQKSVPKKPKIEPRLSPVEPLASVDGSPRAEGKLPEQVRLRSMNEKEEEAYENFKKQKIQIAWQTFQQNQAQIQLLETKNDELEEDIKQMEGKCRYWKDMFERTLADYRQVKSELRKLKARRLDV